MLDTRKVFAFLSKHGQYPKGGPEKVIARFHASAHSNIHARMRSWLLTGQGGELPALERINTTQNRLFGLPITWSCLSWRAAKFSLKDSKNR